MNFQIKIKFVQCILYTVQCTVHAMQYALSTILGETNENKYFK